MEAPSRLLLLIILAASLGLLLSAERAFLPWLLPVVVLAFVFVAFAWWSGRVPADMAHADRKARRVTRAGAALTACGIALTVSLLLLISMQSWLGVGLALATVVEMLLFVSIVWWKRRRRLS